MVALTLVVRGMAKMLVMVRAGDGDDGDDCGGGDGDFGSDDDGNADGDCSCESAQGLVMLPQQPHIPDLR